MVARATPTSASSVRALFASEESAARLLERRRDDVLATLRGFAAAADTADAETSTSGRVCPEDACPALELLDESSTARDDACTLAALTHLKILARDAATRAAFGERGVRTLVRVLKAIDQTLVATEEVPKTSIAFDRATAILLAAEGANAALNACHHPANVAAFAEAGGVQTLTRWLDGGDGGNTRDSRERALRAPGRRGDAADAPAAALRRNAAGALQSACFEPAGRAAAAREDGVRGMLAALKVAASDAGVCENDGAENAVFDPVLVARLTGALHNATADAACVRSVRAAGRDGVPLLVSLLRGRDADAAASAAGAVQNLARERLARLEARRAGAVEALGDLLVLGTTSGKAHAAGALVNLLGPELSGEEAREHEGGCSKSGSVNRRENVAPSEHLVDADSGDARRRALGKLLSSALALSMAWEMIHDAPPETRALA
jgi:hypothetical protein